MGVPVYRAAYARLTINASLVGPVVVLERIDDAFLVSRFGGDARGLWKVGGNHDKHMYEAKNAFARSPAGQALFSSAAAAVDSATSNSTSLAAHFDGQQWMRDFAVIAVVVSYDSLELRNNVYFASTSAAQLHLVAHDFDRTFGVVNRWLVPNATAWPLVWCTAVAPANPWCASMQTAFAAAYRGYVRLLLQSPFMARDVPHALTLLDAQIAPLRRVAPGSSTVQIARFLQDRATFLLAQ